MRHRPVSSAPALPPPPPVGGQSRQPLRRAARGVSAVASASGCGGMPSDTIGWLRPYLLPLQPSGRRPCMQFPSARDTLPGGHSDWRGARREARGLRPGPHGTCVLDNGAGAFGSSGWTAGRALSPTRPGQHWADSRPQAFPGTRRGTQHAVHAVGLRRRGAAREAARPSAPLADGPVRAPLLGELRAGGKQCLLTGELNNGPLFQAPARSLRAHLHGG